MECRALRALTRLIILAVLVASATSTSEPMSPDGELRLVNQNNCPTEGRLEIRIRNQWGTICNDNFGDVDATVACRELGYLKGSTVDKVSSGSGPIWLDEVGCSPTNTRIIDCPANPVGSNDCGHGEDIYIACYNGTSREYCAGTPRCSSTLCLSDAGSPIRTPYLCRLYNCCFKSTHGYYGQCYAKEYVPGSSSHDVREGSIRLVDGACPDEGRIEIYHRTSWGTICDDGFGQEEATVACRELGFDSGVAIKAPAPGTGVIWLDDLACTLQHSSLAECGATRWGREDCSHSEDVGVHCYNSTATEDCYGNPVPEDGAIKLIAGECAYEGRLEVWHAHRWGTICDDGFNDTAATVACMQLGHKYGWVHTAPIASTSTPIWLKSISCNSTATKITECQHTAWGSAYGCDHNRDVGILCSNTSTRLTCSGDSIVHQDGDLRLRDGNCASHGRLEVYHSGRWGTVCDDSFTDIAASVACKQLGYKTGFIKAAPAGTGITWLDNVQCTQSSRGRLVDACRHANWGQEDCGHSEDIGIMCYNGTGSFDCNGVPFPAEGKLQLSDTICAHSGRLEVFHAGRWGTVCDIGFNSDAINVACKEMGHQSGVLGASNVQAVSSVLNAKRIWLKDVSCRSTSPRIVNCTHSPWGSSGCDHNQDVFITCKNGTDALDCSGNIINFVEGQTRLVGGRNTSTGRLEIFHSGRWGTVCDDSFGNTDATVACRELGFHRGSLGSRLLASDGTGPTWLDEVRCLPTHKRLIECNHNPWGREDCGHSEDVRLLCTNLTECDSNPCQNGGTCQLGFNTYTCHCVPGYSGYNCQVNIDECTPQPCVNGGTCIDRVNEYSCQCVLGYEGKNCSQDTDDCANGPCKNGATCVDKLNDYTCVCPDGYSGSLCTTNIDECAGIPCHAGGVCTDGINDFTCTCKPGYKGKRCQVNIDECASNPCANNATCLDGNNWYVCKCPPGFFGKNCAVQIGTNVIDPGKQKGGKQGGGSYVSPPRPDNTTKGVAVAAIIIALIAIVIAIAVIVKFSKGPQRSKAPTLGDRKRADFRWQMLSKYPDSSGDGREDEAAFYNNSSDKVNLVA